MDSSRDIRSNALFLLEILALQTLDQSKPFRGTPQKATDIVEKKKTGHFSYDPRPGTCSCEDYRHRFRSVVLNYSGPDKDMPVNQLFQPANLDGADNDHHCVC